MTLVTVTVFLVLFVPSGAAADIPLRIDGTCREFTAAVTAPADGCFDIKVDVTTAQGRGQVYDPRAGWKSSVFFVEEQCVNEGQELAVYLRAAPGNETLYFKASLRLGNQEWESGFVEVRPTCPVEGVELFLLPVLVAVLLLLVGVAVYQK